MARGDILIVGGDTERVYRYDGSAWDAGIAVPTTESAPTGVAVDPDNGDILIVGFDTQNVFRYASGAWTVVTAIPSGEGFPQGLSIDPDNGDLIVVGLGADRVYRYSGGSWDVGIAVPALGPNPRGVTIDPDNGDILIAANRRVFRHNGTSWDGGILVPGTGTVNGIAVNPESGDVLAVRGTTIYRHDGSSWDSGTAVSASITDPRGMAVDGAGTDHAVDAGAASFAFAVPAATVTHTAAPDVDPLTLSDWDDTGLAVDFAALIEVSGSGETLYADSSRGGSDTPLEGELGLGSGETVISRLWWNGTTFRFNDNDNPVSLNLGTYYQVGGAGNGQTIYLVTGDAESHTETSFDVATYLPAFNLRGDGWVNWGAGEDPLPADVIEQLDGLDAGDRLVIASARAVAAHAVDAVAASFAFAVPAAAVTHTAAAVHTVNAGAAAFTFAVPQPTVTRTLPDSHAVDAAPAAFTFAVPEPSITHDGAVVHAVDAVAATFTFAVPQPAVTRTAAAAHAVDATPATFTFTVPEPTVTSSQPAAHTVDADAVTFTFSVPQPSVTSTAAAVHAVDADPAAFTFAVPQPTVTSTAPSTHAVDADPVAFTFHVPQPTVTRSIPDSHAVNAAAAAFAFAVPEPTVTRTAAVRAAITASRITSTPQALPDTYGIDETIVCEVTYNMPVDVTGTPQFPINLGDSPPEFPDYADYISGSGSTALVFHWIVAATDLDANGVFLYAGTHDDGHLILNGGTIRNAGTLVDAGLTLQSVGLGVQSNAKVDGSIGGTTDYAVDADAAAFAFDVPEPAVTSTLPSTHAVDASPAAFTFAVPEPEIVHTGTSVYAVDATPATFGFHVPRPRVTYYSPVTHGVNAVAATFVFHVPQPRITTTGEAATHSAMRLWLFALLLPWDQIPERWATAIALAETKQALIDAAGQAEREWSPVTCRTQSLPTWGRILRRPRRDGESTDDYRVRLATWRAEPVGQSGWIRDEVQRATGDDPPRVIEFPRDGLRLGYDRLGVARLGGGPSLTVGVEPVDRAVVEAVLEPGVAARVSIVYLDPTVFDSI